MAMVVRSSNTWDPTGAMDLVFGLEGEWLMDAVVMEEGAFRESEDGREDDPPFASNLTDEGEDAGVSLDDERGFFVFDAASRAEDRVKRGVSLMTMLD